MDLARPLVDDIPGNRYHRYAFDEGSISLNLGFRIRTLKHVCCAEFTQEAYVISLLICCSVINREEVRPETDQVAPSLYTDK